MLFSLTVKLVQIGYRLGVGNPSAGCGNDLIEAGRHGKSQQLYGREIESLVIDLSKIGLSTKKLTGNLRREGGKTLVPSKGLEPPHPCGYMDLNHARLPIPPRWQKVIRYGATHSGHLQERTTANILQGHRLLSYVEVGLQASGFRLWQLSQKRPLTS